MNEMFEISVEKLLQGIEYCIYNITDLINKSQKACEQYTDNSIALGLYTFAVEEFGKLMFLKEAKKEKNNPSLIPKNIFVGRESHKIKFDNALKYLPTECVQPVYGIEVNVNTNYDDVDIPLNPQGAKARIAGGTTGTFMEIGDYPIDLITRMACFYLDWDEKTKKWKTKPKVISAGLHRATTKLGLIVKGIKLELENDIKKS